MGLRRILGRGCGSRECRGSRWGLRPLGCRRGGGLLGIEVGFEVGSR